MLTNENVIKLMASKETFKVNLRMEMAKRGLRAAEICRTLNIDKNTFSGWYNGKYLPSPIMLDKLCKFFNVAPNVLIGSDNSSITTEKDVDYMKQLKEIIGYYKEGLITLEEYNTLKAKIMESLK